MHQAYIFAQCSKNTPQCNLSAGENKHARKHAHTHTHHSVKSLQFVADRPTDVALQEVFEGGGVSLLCGCDKRKIKTEDPCFLGTNGDGSFACFSVATLLHVLSADCVAFPLKGKKKKKNRAKAK